MTTKKYIDLGVPVKVQHLSDGLYALYVAGTLTATVDETAITALLSTIDGHVDGLENLTTLMSAKLPAALGPAVKANSFTVTQATDPDTRTGALTITARDIVSSSASGQDSSGIITGAPTAGSEQKVAINGQACVLVLISGTWTGTLAFEASEDGGTTWVNIPMRVKGSVFTRGSVTANAFLYGDVAGASHFRVRSTAVMTGTANVNMNFSADSGAVQLLNPVRLYDNTTGAEVSILAASTMAAATDKSEVVQLHPYSGRSTTGTKTNVNDAAASTTLLAANADRKGFTITNDSASGLYLDLSGGTASSTSYSVFVPPGGYYQELGARYTGGITGIWTADSTGAARMTEYT